MGSSVAYQFSWRHRGDRMVGSTSGFLFPVPEEVCYLMCGGVFLLLAYFGSGERLKFAKRNDFFGRGNYIVFTGLFFGRVYSSTLKWSEQRLFCTLAIPISVKENVSGSVIVSVNVNVIENVRVNVSAYVSVLSCPVLSCHVLKVVRLVLNILGSTTGCLANTRYIFA